MVTTLETVLKEPTPSELSSDAHTLAHQFKDAMRRIASSVMIITTRGRDGRPHGMAASAVISLSLEPPSLLASVNRAASIHAVLSERGKFCVNVLCESQMDLIPVFSTAELREKRFLNGDWSDGPYGIPYLRSAACSLFCNVDQRTHYGTHTQFIGKVSCVSNGSPGLPLVWLAGASFLTHTPDRQSDCPS